MATSEVQEEVTTVSTNLNVGPERIFDWVEINDDLNTPNFSTEIIARDNSYGIMVFKPDAVNKDLVEIMIAHVLSSEQLKGKAEISSIAILKTIETEEDLKSLYPDLKPEIWKANRELFSSDYTVVALFKGKGIDMQKELKKIKGKIRTDPNQQGLGFGLRGLIPTVGEVKIFEEISRKKKYNEQLTKEDYYNLARNLVHTPDDYSEKLSILNLTQKYCKNGLTV